jgi:hypothetical protein
MVAGDGGSSGWTRTADEDAIMTLERGRRLAGFAPSGGFMALAIRTAAIAVAVSIVVTSSFVVRDQWIANQAENVLRRMIRLDWSDDASVKSIEELQSACLLACGSRVRLAAAAAKVVRAQRNAEHRPVLLERAVADLSDILGQDPGAVEGWIWQARAQILSGDGSALDSVLKSYDAAPFDLTHALWRIAVVNDRWAAASPALRTHVLDEAFWYGSIFPPKAREVTAVMSNPTANLALTLRRKTLVGNDQSPDRKPIF